MKKIKLLLAMVLVFTTLLMTSITAGASNYIPQADALNQMGLFLGTGNGYELDRIPTRAEAAVMLVRLLGKEAEVKAGEFSHPYLDVPSWVNNYVGYLYQNGLTKGTSALTFSPQISCSSQMYTVFVLRSLGYTEDNGSFTYNQAELFAEYLGLINSSESTGMFLRDNMVAESYSALFQYKKDGTDTLLDTLIESGAVSQSSADAILSVYQIYEEYTESCIDSYLDISTDIITRSNTDITLAGQTISMSQDSEVSTVVNGDQLTVQGVDCFFDGFYTEVIYYYNDGWIYVFEPAGNLRYKMRTELNKSDYIAAINISASPFYMMNHISSSTEGGETTFTIEYSPDAFMSFFASEFSALSSSLDITDFDISSLKEIVVFGSDGKMITQTITCNVDATLNLDGEIYPMSIAIKSSTRICDTGDSVTIPVHNNLDQYVEITD